MFRPTRRFGHNPNKPNGSKIQPINKIIDEPDRFIGADIVVNSLGQ
jgi:hypothetical protein